MEDTLRFDALKDLDKDILNPKKLMIITILYLTGPKTMAQLVKATGLSWGDLDTHIKKLKERGIVEVKKRITPYGIRTVVALTPQGARLFLETASKLEQFLELIRKHRKAS